MGFEFCLEEKEGYLLALPRGDDPSTEEWCTASEAMFLEAHGRSIPRILINRLEEEISFDALDAVHVAKFLQDLEFQQLGFRIGVLAKPEALEAFTMLETIMTNRAFAYKVFADKDAALQWLMGG